MKYFYKDIELEVPSSCYYPREDSELLAEAIENLDIRGKKCLDMGCGAGLLAIIMAKQGAIATAADINLDSVQATRTNAAVNDAEVYAVFSDLFSNVAETFDFIVFNPPYLPGEEKEKNELTYYGGKSGREVIKNFLATAKKFFKRNGKIFLLISTVTGEEEVKQIAIENGYSVTDITRKRVPWEELIILQMRTE